MSRQIRQYLPVLKQIARLRDSARRTYLKNCDRRFIDCISECAKNVLKQRSVERELVQTFEASEEERASVGKQAHVAETEARDRATASWISQHTTRSRDNGTRIDFGRTTHSTIRMNGAR